jgi:hypothetical protein
MAAPHRTGTRLQLFSRRLIFRFASKGVFGTRQIAVNVILSSRPAVANASPVDFGEVEFKVPIDSAPHRLSGRRSFILGFAPGGGASVGDLILHVWPAVRNGVGFVSQNDFVIASIFQITSCGEHHRAGFGNTATLSAGSESSSPSIT